MRIQHNIAALNSYRNLTNNNNAVSKNLEKLSSGYRINRAGDDAAGLAISEKMRAQITGLNTAQKNANDGISLVQTAEGALTEVHSMLNRMVELANQSANGTYADAPDRENLQAEVDSLLEEIDRISKATNFNGINLLDGSLGLNGNTFDIGAARAAVKAGDISGDAIGNIEAKHADVRTEEVEPEFTINFADLEVHIPAGTAGNLQSAAGSLSIGGQTISIHDANTDLETESTIEIGQTTTASSAAASDVAALFDGKVAVIGNDVYDIADNGDGTVTFTYAGQKNESTNKFIDKDAVGGEVQKDSWKPVGDVIIDFTGANIKNRDNCHLTEIKDPVAGGDPVRAGAALELTEDIINRGKLTIGDTTFVFDKTKTEAQAVAAGDTKVIGIKDLSGDKLLEAVTRQMSNHTADINIEDKDGNDHAFTIGRGDTTGKIEIEEKVITTGKYGNFSAEELKAAFTQSQTAANANTSVTLKDTPKIGDSIKIGDKTYTFGEGEGKIAIGANKEESAKNLAAAVKKDGYKVEVTDNKVTVFAAKATDEAPSIGSSGLTLQIGDTSDDFNRMNVNVRSMSAKSLGIDGIDISTQGGAQAAVDKIKAAINDVSSQRGDLGAIQNRLEHTINNLSVTAENMTAAESRIRDVDMAEEMMAYTKNNILVQAAQAMLAQANQVPQGVLQLLQ